MNREKASQQTPPFEKPLGSLHGRWNSTNGSDIIFLSVIAGLPENIQELWIMTEKKLIQPAGVGLISRKFPFAAFIGLMLILLTGGFTLQPGHEAAGLHRQASAPTATVSSQGVSSEPRYYKKELVFKRLVAEADSASIRTSAQTDGYKALMSIPLPVVMPQFSVRMPQFPNTSALNNYQALSTLGTAQFYNNLNVQQYLSSMENQQFLNDLSAQQRMNNLANQQDLNNYQQYLNDLSTQQNLNNLNNQQYLNNYQQSLNDLSAQQFLNNLDTQQYLNNFNTYTSPTFNQPSFTQPSFTQPSFTQPSFTQPMPQIYTPPTIYNPPMIYNPPPSFNSFP